MISLLRRWRGCFQAVNEAKVLVSKTMWSMCSNLFTPKIDPVLPLRGYLRTQSSFWQDFAFHSYLNRSGVWRVSFWNWILSSFSHLKALLIRQLKIPWVCRSLVTVGEPRQWCAAQELLQHTAFLPMPKPQILPQCPNTVGLVDWVPIPC